jgi:Cu(I)/Ag(I) efflux system membrane fusion protein
VYVEHARGSYEPRSVRLGRIGDELAEVTDGLAEGEVVVTQGNLLLDSQSQIAGRSGSGDSGAANLLMPHAAAEPAALPPYPAAGTPTRPLNAEVHRAISDFLKATDAVREALAADDLARFNTTAKELHPAVAALPKDAVPAALAAAAAAAHLPEAADLPAARKAFYPLSMALVEAVRGLREEKDFPGLRLYQCPMMKQAFPGAPKAAAWFQYGEPIQNPWFGPAMLDCGTELKP